jgi:N-acetylneuraminic acid mutarotase
LVIVNKISGGGGPPPRGHDFAVYDTETDKWEVLPDMPSDRNHLTGGAVDGKLYFMGGRVVAGGPGKMWDVVEMYDPATRTWSKRAQMPRARGGIFGGVVKGCIHVFGGEGNDTDPRGVFPDHDVYNPKIDKWTHLPDMMIPVHAVNGMGVYNDVIYIPGGAITSGADSNSTQLQVYNPDTSCQ